LQQSQDQFHDKTILICRDRDATARVARPDKPRIGGFNPKKGRSQRTIND
jgi:hypothetical protein